MLQGEWRAGSLRARIRRAGAIYLGEMRKLGDQVSTVSEASNAELDQAGRHTVT
jgi:hypothetical protein